MKDKYYTPTIEEFYVGFEFEVNYEKEGWQSEVFCKGERAIWSTAQLMNNFTRDGKLKGSIRVKHLDREDIESLGWEMTTETYFHKRTSQTSSIDILFNQEEGRVEVQSTEAMDDEPVTILFQGTIKNKSELKKLLKQLGI